MDVQESSVDAVINHVLRALDRPRRISSTGESNDLSHIIQEFSPLLPPLPAEDPAIDLLETIIQESSSSLSAHKIVESNSVSSKRSFWSKLFAKKSQDGASIASIGSENDSSASSTALKAAEEQVAQLEASGPTDLTSVSALSREINRKICVWSSGMSLRHEVGASRPGAPLNVQFHSQPEDIMGHWSLLGNLDPQEASSGLNDCLFNAIAAQTGLKPVELREVTVARMKTNIRSVARRIQELARRESCDRIVLMVGGARYHGSTAKDAGRVLDKSQEGRGHPSHAHGHPRGHASNPSATGPTSSAENYSRGGWKTAFLSVDDQDDVGNRALHTEPARRAMEVLNAGGTRQVVTIDASQIPGSLPQGAHFNDGQRGAIQEIRDLVLVLQHHAGHQSDPDYDVFVHTFYPRLGINKMDTSDDDSSESDDEDMSWSSESSDSLD
ncbi:uncharacterized protein LOC141532386 [Cotesia typhae]|uniref:uncharacterized protein LOC141532386 n=1 Tax=Cotesia typhae TaxID=2053667 RepID=UPI003D6955F1